MKQYYKILNKEENHNGLQYKTGLNTDILPFNPSGNCTSGGIYFTDVKNIFRFLDYGPWIREVTLPENEQIYEETNKYKAHRVILGKRRKIMTLKVIKELIGAGADPTVNDNHAIQWAAGYGHLNVVKYLVSIGCDPTVNDNHAIQWAAGYGRLNVVKYLVSEGCDPKACNNQAIRLAAENGHLNVVKYLVSIGCDHPTIGKV